MVNNAKAYNERPSPIFQDAERIRKMLSNYMVKNNPAYKDPNYIASPTPIPAHLLNSSRDTNGDTPTAKPSRKETPARATISPAPATASAGPMDTDDTDFTGKTFQQAQDQIMGELIKHQEE